MINLELLTEVLNKTSNNQRYFYIDNVLLENNVLSFSFVSDEGYNCETSMSIYEFLHKCKMWIYINGYEFVIYFKKNLIDLYLSKDFNKVLHELVATEEEAIIKTCEFILKNIKDQK